MIDTTKILPGQEFKNMQELSVALTGKKMPAGNRYVVRVNEMKKYFSWDKVPGTNRIIITDVFKEPITKERKKYKKRKTTVPKEYYPQGKYNSMMYANLTTLQLNQKYSVNDLFELLGMTSEKFTRPKYYLDCVNSTDLSLSAYKYFYNKINELLSRMLYSTLRNFKQRGCISYHTEYRFTFKNGYKEVEIPTEIIEEAKEQALQETSYQNEWSVLHSSKAQDYKQLILNKLSQYGVKRYVKCYVFTDIKQFDKLPQPSLSVMNALTIEKLYKYSSRFDTVNQKKINSIINVSILGRER